jgi:hypothetical protein
MSAAAVAALLAAVAKAAEDVAEAQAAATAAAGIPAGPAAQANVAKTAAEGMARIASMLAGSGALRTQSGHQAGHSRRTWSDDYRRPHGGDQRTARLPHGRYVPGSDRRQQHRCRISDGNDRGLGDEFRSPRKMFSARI